MSIVAFKKKSVINYGAKRSGKPPGGYWLPQGPFGSISLPLEQAITNYGPVGFSINGSYRNKGRVGQEMKFSKNGTPFRGVHAFGNGGNFGKYYRGSPVMNACPGNSATCDQYLYVKPSTLSTFGQLRKQYKWAYYGKYPNYWVQPLVGGTWQADSKSQGMYLHDKRVANTCYINVNDKAKYVDYKVSCGPTLCTLGLSTAQFKYNDMVRNAPYTKELAQPIPSSEYTDYIQRRCANPRPHQKPFPYAVQTGTGTIPGGTSIRSVANSCNTSNTYTKPPEWYTKSKNGMSQ